MVSMKTYANIALCMLFALHSLVHADQGNEGYVQTYSNVQAKGFTPFTPQKELGGNIIIGGRKMLVVKNDVFSPVVETNDYRSLPRRHPPKPNGKNAKKTPWRSDNTSNYQKNKKGEGEEEEWKAEETEETELMNLMNRDYRGAGKPRRKPPIPA